MLKHCLSIAISIAWALPVAKAANLPVPRPDESMPPIQRCVVESLRVDGIAVVQHGWCYWDGEQRMWVPLSSDLARHRVFGIRPVPD